MRSKLIVLSSKIKEQADFIDLNHDGSVTIGEIARAIIKIVIEVLHDGRI